MAGCKLIQVHDLALPIKLVKHLNFIRIMMQFDSSLVGQFCSWSHLIRLLDQPHLCFQSKENERQHFYDKCLGFHEVVSLQWGVFRNNSECLQFAAKRPVCSY